VLPVATTDADLRGGAEIGRLVEITQRLADDRPTVALAVTSSGRLNIEGVDLPPVDAIPGPPRRPRADGLVPQRIELPRALPDGVPIRLAGLAVTLPGPVRSRFTRQGIAMVSLYEAEDGWYLSGIAQGRPMYVLVGRVAAY
jgi:hypothetical protein